MNCSLFMKIAELNNKDDVEPEEWRFWLSRGLRMPQEMKVIRFAAHCAEMALTVRYV